MKAYNKEKIKNIENSILQGQNQAQLGIFYRNMPDTRRSGINYVMSQEELIEWAKCYNNPIYFIETYCKTVLNVNNEPKIALLKLYDYQKKIIEKFKEERHIIIFNSRQTGASTVLAMLFLHQMLFDQNISQLHWAPVYGKRFNFLNKIKMAYVGLPFFLKQGITKWNDNNLAFENGCEITCTNTKNLILINEETNLPLYDIINISEIAYFKEEILTRNYYKLIPVIAANPNIRLILNSSISNDDKDNSKDFFTDLVQHSELPDEAPDKNLFSTLRIYWWQKPNQDMNWKNETIKIWGKDAFDAENDLKF